MQTLTLPEADITNVDNWDERLIDDTHRIVGLHGVAWFVQALPYHRVVALPPVHLTILEATAWFLYEQNKNERNAAQ